jgi:hypothetical protein
MWVGWRNYGEFAEDEDERPCRPRRKGLTSGHSVGRQAGRHEAPSRSLRQPQYIYFPVDFLGR